MISTRTKKQDKEQEHIIAMQQKKLWEKYFSTNDSRTKLECISKLHDLTLALANLQYDDYMQQQQQQNYNLYNNYKKSPPLKRGYKLSNSPNTSMVLSRFINNNNDEDLR
jgi:hypothetical protein